MATGRRQYAFPPPHLPARAGRWHVHKYCWEVTSHWEGTSRSNNSPSWGVLSNTDGGRDIVEGWGLAGHWHSSLRRCCLLHVLNKHLPTIICPPLQAYQDAAPSSPWPQQQQGIDGASTSTATSAGPQQAAQQQAAQRRPRIATYRGLSAAHFQHPLDQQNTALLRALPGLEMLARNMMGPVAEKVRGWGWGWGGGGAILFV